MDVKQLRAHALGLASAFDVMLECLFLIAIGAWLTQLQHMAR